MFKNKLHLTTTLSVLSLLLVLSLLSGCGIIIINDPTADNTTGNAATITIPRHEDVTTSPDFTHEMHTPVVFPSRLEEAEARLDALIDLDLSEFDMLVTVSTDTTDVIFPTSEDPLYAPRTNRNVMIEEKYGCGTLTAYFTTDELLRSLELALKTGEGDFYSSLLVVPANRAGEFYTRGLLYDLRSLPFTDTESGNTSGNIGKSRYFVTNAATDTPEHLGAIFFNRTLLGDVVSSELADAAIGGSLSLEMLLSAYTKVQTESLSAFSTDLSKSEFGQRLAIREGVIIVTDNEKDKPRVTLTLEKAQAFDNLISSLTQSSFYFSEGTDRRAFDKFVDSEALFYFGTLNEMTSLYAKPVKWGLLPLPQTGDGEIRGVTSDDIPVICVPAIITQYELTTLWIQAADAASGDWMRDQYLAVAIEKYLRDNDSCLVLRKILTERISPDFASLFSQASVSLQELKTAIGLSASGGETLAQAHLRLAEAINKELSALK